LDLGKEEGGSVGEEAGRAGEVEYWGRGGEMIGRVVKKMMFRKT
jgi:hypothetical protein